MNYTSHLVCGLVVLMGASASAGPFAVPVELSDGISSSQAKSYARDYLFGLDGCFQADPDLLAKIDERQRIAEQLKDAHDRGVFVKYWKDLRAYVAPRMTSVPGFGTFTALAATTAKKTARLQSAYPAVDRTAPAAFLAEVAARNQLVAETAAFKTKFQAASPCFALTGDWAAYTAAADASNSAASEGFEKAGVDDLVREFQHWRTDAGHFANLATPTTWAKYNEYTTGYLKFTAATQRLLAQAPTLKLLAPMRDEYAYLATVSEELATWEQVAVAKSLELLEGAKPGERNKKPAADQIALSKKLLVDFRISYDQALETPAAAELPATSTLLTKPDPWPHPVKDFKEWRGDVLVHVKYRGFTSWYVTKAPALLAASGLPTLPGIDPTKDICFLAASNFYYYDLGAPDGIPSKKWYRESNEALSPMLCKNAKTLSPLR